MKMMPSARRRDNPRRNAAPSARRGALDDDDFVPEMEDDVPM
jgi:hypothetical protein